MVYRNGDASDQAYYSVISVSGTTVSASTVATLDNDNSIDARDLAITYDTSADRVAVIYYDQGDSGKIKSYVGTVTGGTTNSVAWGSSVEADGAASNVHTRLCYDVATNRHLLVWRDDSGIQSRVGTLTGSSTNTIAWGAQTTLNTDTPSDVELLLVTYEATQEKCVLGWFSGSSTQKFGVVTVTGSSTNTAAIGSLVSVTIDYVLHEPNSNALSAIAASKVAYVYNVSDTVKVVPFTISGTSLSAGTAVTVASADTANIQIAGVVATGAAAITFETNNVSINAIEYRSATISGGGVLATNLDNNYLGVAAETISDTNTGKITLNGGVNENQTGLTIGDDYFSDGAGNIKQFLTSATSTNASPTGNFAVMDDSDTTSADVSSIYESNSSTFVLAYKDSAGSSYGTAVAGTWSSGTVTWGTPVVFESSAIDDQPHLCSGGNRIHVTYRASDGAGGIRSGSISGTTITFAAETVFAPNNATYGNAMSYHCVYDTSTNYVIIAYSGGTSSQNGYAQPLFHDTSDGTYTLGAATTLFTNQVQVSQNTDLVFDPDTNRSIVVYTDGTNSNQVTAQVIQSSGTSGSPTVTVGSDVIIDAGDASAELCACYDTQNNKVFVAYKNNTDSNDLKGIIGTVTGGTDNTISFAGNASIWNPSGNPAHFDIEFDGDDNKAYLFYRDEDSGDDFTYKILTLGASSFSVADGAVLTANDNRLNSGSASYGSGKGVLVGTMDAGNSNKLSYGTVYYGDTITYTQTDNQFVGRAIAADKLLLEEQDPNIIYGRADAAITAGKPVQVRSDGEFEEIKESTTSYTAAVGTAVEYLNSDTIASHDVAYDTYRNKVILATHGTSAGTLRVYVGTVTGGTTNSISWGSAQDVYTKNGDSVKIAYDPVSYQTMVTWVNSSNGRIDAVVITEDGDNTITAGSITTTLEGSATERRHDVINVGERKWVICYRDNSDTYYKTRVLTTSGTTITAETETVIKSSAVVRFAVAHNSSDSQLGYFWNESTSGDLKAAVASISGNSISGLGTEQTLTSGAGSLCNGGSAVYDAGSGKFVCASRKMGNSGEITTFTAATIKRFVSLSKQIPKSTQEKWGIVVKLQPLLQLQVIMQLVA